ncbi:MAG: lipoprotein-releasing system transmembrane subunit LolC [Candidatus Dactylopiibacterium carminicum]|uniref:ABC transporter permease n=1 Tax=Candidatus Dactylopiibacterium carminicum TaxID=857335 RepID=A0A272EUM5_9RHOO|nr:lipoprotein-releasing ABC transporter permease subunit [Candidatus Dactylopiibacterium carminicum]KAF7600377.1 ABC transporter permease [Candidatus Dactylopiibacterium carminicum]PAS93794.1 MAG: lipoprotein-releasing system transmembrane subunit LolC [Candidatus Dactylopiibacterium carminicum]PAS96832.1 MAG: lipoprotein-releasing system transmembrane subunit LolC [Candidatus Dactylopiibacterium carminicum]PAT00377.1 MAG: ABC transporter permease [Candidatus Dactylopiibacterium carminicum]
MKFPILVGLRYVRAKRRNASGGSFISFISFVSMAGIALGVMALIVVLSVMNGFQDELRSRILGVAAHAQIMGYDGELRDWEQVAKLAEGRPEVLASAPFVQQQAMFSIDQSVRGAIVRGIDPVREEGVAEFASKMKAGVLTDLRPGEFGVILGRELAMALGARVGDKVTLIAPQGLVTPAAVLPRVKQFRLVGIFEAGMYEFDSGLALLNIQDAQVLYQMGDAVSGVRLRLKELFDAPRVSRQLSQQLPPDAYVTDWTQSHANFFRAVQMEKTVMFIILTLIVAVAAFNIVSALVMAVQDKRADIAILRTLGASPAAVMAIFVIQGAVMGLIGLGAGVVGGVSLALNITTVVPWIERTFGVQFLAKDVYYISDLPSKLLWGDVVGVVGVAFVLTLVATLYPSWRASRVNPAEALRYE